MRVPDDSCTEEDPAATTSDSYHIPRPGAADGNEPASLGARRVAVVVLGDIGRSPRMVYHALALAGAGAHVEFFGYRETDIDPELADHAAIAVHPLPAPPSRLPRRLFVVRGLWRSIRQAGELTRRLLRVAPGTILVQTPPAVPTLLVAFVVSRWLGCRWVIDWHNFGWKLLEQRLGARHPIAFASRAWELVLGRCADAHLCVSRAMAAALSELAGVRAEVLYDKPAERFAPASAPARDAARAALTAELGLARRPALVVVPTGWTEDEDIGLLIDAARYLDRSITDRSDDFPDVVIVATGRGPLRAHWQPRMEALDLRRVHLLTRWLAAEDYPAFLAAADVGVSLHRSASGVDLPMKIVDLLGAGVPVCALAYGACLGEMLEDGVTGLVFDTAAQLATELESLLQSRDDPAAVLATLRRNVVNAADERWHEGWERTARPLLLP